MAALFDSNHQIAKEVTLSVGNVGASAVATQDFTVGGVRPEVAYDLKEPVAFSAGLFVLGAKCLSKDTLQVAFFNTTGAGIAHGETTFRLTSR